MHGGLLPRRIVRIRARSFFGTCERTIRRGALDVGEGGHALLTVHLAVRLDVAWSSDPDFVAPTVSPTGIACNDFWTRSECPDSCNWVGYTCYNVGDEVECWDYTYSVTGPADCAAATHCNFIGTAANGYCAYAVETTETDDGVSGDDNAGDDTAPPPPAPTAGPQCSAHADCAGFVSANCVRSRSSTPHQTFLRFLFVETQTRAHARRLLVRSPHQTFSATPHYPPPPGPPGSPQKNNKTNQRPPSAARLPSSFTDLWPQL